MQQASRKTCIREVEQRREQILDLARYLHQHPEPAMKEYLAAEKVTKLLRAEGFAIREPLDDIPTAVMAYKKNGSGPRVALVAEYDALPNIGHACGHNLIAAMSVGAALALGAMLDKYQGEVWLIGTPAEETAEGKGLLLERHAFDQVDVAMMIHPGNVTIPAPITLASISMKFDFYGKTSHAASAPELGVNALDAVIQLFNSVNALRQQTREDARIHGIISEGGEAPNIIPDKASVKLIVRSKDTDYCHELAEKVKNCACGAAMATGTQVQIGYYEGSCESLESNEKLVDIFREQLKYLGIPEFTGNSSSASTDMGNVSRVLPALHPLLKVTKREEAVDHHTTAYTELTGSEEVEDATVNGAKLLALVGLEILSDPELLPVIQNAGRIHG